MRNLAKFTAAINASNLVSVIDAAAKSGSIFNAVTGRVDMRMVKTEVCNVATTTTADGKVLKLWVAFAILEGIPQATFNLKNQPEWCAAIEELVKPYLIDNRPTLKWTNDKVYKGKTRETVDISEDAIQF